MSGVCVFLLAGTCAASFESGAVLVPAASMQTTVAARLNEVLEYLQRARLARQGMPDEWLAPVEGSVSALYRDVVGHDPDPNHPLSLSATLPAPASGWRTTYCGVLRTVDRLVAADRFPALQQEPPQVELARFRAAVVRLGSALSGAPASAAATETAPTCD